MSPKKLLVVIDEMEVGGSQRQIAHLLMGLDRTRWQPELLYFRNHSFLIDRLRDAGVPVRQLHKRGRVDMRFLRNFAELLRQGDYDLIHAFSLTAELWAVVAKMLAGVDTPLVASERNQQVRKPAWYWPLKRFIVTRSAGVIANSEAGARTTATHTRVPQTFFDTIPNGVELPAELSTVDRALVRAEIGVPPGRQLCLFVGRLVPQKNLDCLLLALSRVDPQHRPWLAIAGDGPLRQHVEGLVAGLGLSADVRLLGERSDATRLMQSADFLVLPSHFEGLSNSLLEAMAAACPVIASAVGGTPELIQDGRTGLLFPSDDATALVSRIESLATDESLRTALGRNARDYVGRTYGIPALVSATTKVYERCMARGRHDTPQRTAGLVSQQAEDSHA